MAEQQDVTRRDFVVAAGAVTTVAAALPGKVEGFPFIQKVRAANEQVQYGMIGTGSRGSYLLKHLKGIDNGRCVAGSCVWETRYTACPMSCTGHDCMLPVTPK